MIREIDMGSKKELAFEYWSGGKQLGDMTLRKVKRGRRVVWSVGGIDVRPGSRRKGIATALYEHAARAACAQGAPLASDERVSIMSEGFWQKQITKGRASVLCTRCGVKKTPVYTLSCPAPVSLKGARKRKRVLR